MRNILKKIGAFFEAHVEKVVLGIIGLICIWILLVMVLFSPNVVEYEKRNFSPGQIDSYIDEEHAKDLQDILNTPPEPLGGYEARLDGALDTNDPIREGIPGEILGGYVGLLASSIRGVEMETTVPVPGVSITQANSRRSYELPEVGRLENVNIGHIRAAAYLPTLEVTRETSYADSSPEPNDLDLVTVEAEYDTAELYKRFYHCFEDESLPPSWRDPCLAQPAFAAVNLQRQELLENGRWSQWQDVPRSKIDPYQSLFTIIEDAKKLPAGGINVRRLQYKEKLVQMELLQPTAYQIASAYEDWLPPALHKEYISTRNKVKAQEKRDAREEGKEDQQRNRTNTTGRERRGRTPRGRAGTNTTAGGYADGAMGETGRRSRRTRTDRSDRTTAARGARGAGAGEPAGIGDLYGGMMGGQTEDTRPRYSTDEVYTKLDKAMLNYTTDLSKMDEPLLIWAHDDTVESGKTYRYRIRLGVLNPTAGTGDVAEEYASLKDQVILWTPFLEVPDEVTIPPMMCFFARDIREAEKSVTVEVSKFVLGYWHSEDFRVQPGEIIGKVVETETENQQVRTIGGAEFITIASPVDQATMPETIDYSTGAIVVDVVRVDDWETKSNALKPRIYHDMLYSKDNEVIEHMPVRANNWPEDLREVRSQIRLAQSGEMEALRGWDSQKSNRRQRGRRQEGSQYQMYEEMGGPYGGGGGSPYGPY